MSLDAYDGHFVDWVADQKEMAKDRARASLEELACLDRFNRLHSQLDRQSVIPFVGAGMSKPMGFHLWGGFLEGLTADYPAIHDQIKDMVAGYEYEEAAQCLLDRMGEAVFAEAIQSTFGSRYRSIKGSVQLLPLLFTRGCITTNFDYVLDRVYEENGHKFKGEFSGARLSEAPRRLVDEPHCILRLHGEAESGHGRVLTQAEYIACYGHEGRYQALYQTIISNCSLLFLGCSLSADRTFQVLRDLMRSARVETPRHFAFLPLYKDTDREARRRELGEADIHPIWYPPEDHDQAIEDLLISLLEGGFHD